MGAKKSPTEAPNSLYSASQVKVLDLLGEGKIKGFVVKSGVYGDDPLVSTYYDDTPVRNLDGSYNFNVSGEFSFGYTFGEPDQSPISGFERIENLLPIPSNPRIAYYASGEGDSKQVLVGFNSDTYPDANSIKVAVRLPALQQQNKAGSVNGYELKYAVDISLNNGPFVEQAETTINGKCSSPYVQELSYVLPKTTPAQSRYEWRVRTRRTTQTITNSKTANDIGVESVSVVSNNKFSYPNSALVGTLIDFSQFSAIPTRAYEIDGLEVSVPSGYLPPSYNVSGGFNAATYPSVWGGTFDSEKRWTSNPAWVMYDLITNKRYGLGNHISLNSIDKWSLYEIAQYCDDLISDGEGGLEPRFSCNVIIADRRDAYELLLNLSSVFRGMLYWSNGRIISNQNRPKNPVFDFTNANVVNGSFLYSDTAGYTRTTVVTVKYTNPRNLYKEDSVLIEDHNSIARYGYVNKEVTAFGCSSRAQAYRVGKWILSTERLTTETITFQAGLESIYLRPGDVFSVYDNYRNGTLQGGRVSAYNTDKSIVTLDKPINLQAGQTYSLSVAAPVFNISSTGEITGSSQIPSIRAPQIENRLVMTSGISGVSQITVNSGFSDAAFAGSVWILSNSGSGAGIFDRATEYQCLALSEISNGIIEVLGLEYNTGIYNFGDYSVATLPVNSGDYAPISPPSNLTISTVTGLTSDSEFFSYLKLNWDPSPSDNVSYYISSGKEFDSTFSLFSRSAAKSALWQLNSTGYHTFDVHAVSYGDIPSTSITGGYLIGSTNPLGGPPPIEYLFVTGDYQTNYLGTGFTGYYGNSPIIAWKQPVGADEEPDVRDQFVSGYRLYLTDPSTHAVIHGPITTADSEYQVPEDVLNTGSHRMFRANIQVLDIFGGTTGNSGVFNNPVVAQPYKTGFQQSANTLQYSFGSTELDVTGVNLWLDPSISFVPTFANVDYTSDSLSSFYVTEYYSSYYLWYSLGDSFNRGDGTIYGPTLITPANANQNPFNLGFFLENQPDETGVAIGELVASRGFLFTGYGVSCRTVGSANLSGSLYYCDLDNSNRTSLGQFGLTAGSTNRLQSFASINVPNMKKVGYDITSVGADMEKMALGLFGYEVK